MSLPLSPSPTENPRETLLLVRVAETPLSLVSFSFTEHEIPREAYSFLDKLATGDFYSPLRLSDTRPFPPPGELFRKLSRNNPPGVFASPILTRQSSILNLHHQSSIINPQSSITNPSPVACPEHCRGVRHPSPRIPRGGYSFLAKLAQSDFYSALRPSNTRPFPPPSESFLKLSRNNPSRVSFRLPNPQSPIFNPQSSIPNPQSSILNHQSELDPFF